MRHAVWSHPYRIFEWNLVFLSPFLRFYVCMCVGCNIGGMILRWWWRRTASVLFASITIYIYILLLFFRLKLLRSQTVRVWLTIEYLLLIHFTAITRLLITLRSLSLLLLLFIYSAGHAFSKRQTQLIIYRKQRLEKKNKIARATITRSTDREH